MREGVQREQAAERITADGALGRREPLGTLDGAGCLADELGERGRGVACEVGVAAVDSRRAPRGQAVVPVAHAHLHDGARPPARGFVDVERMLRRVDDVDDRRARPARAGKNHSALDVDVLHQLLAFCQVPL